MKVSAIKCPSCGDTIYSRARHDYRPRSCGEIAIDGGRDYVRMAFKTVAPKSFKIEVKATEKQLIEDWNTGTNKYELVSGKNKSVKK